MNTTSTAQTQAPTRRPAWKALAEHYQSIRRLHLRQLFADEPRRGERFRSGEWRGHTGKRIRNIISIGIGGSGLGPVMAYEALRHYSQRDMHSAFIANVDGTDFAEATRDLAAEEL